MSESWKKAGEEDKVNPQDGDKKESAGQFDELEGKPEFAELLDNLRGDRKRVDRQIQLDHESELEYRLDQALRNGHANGRRRSVTNRRKRISLQMGVAAVCLMLMLTAFVRISPAFAAIVKEIPGFGRFVELVSYDRSLMTALDHEYFQLVNQSDERNGYTFTVNGVLADSQRIVLLYTAEGPGITEENMTFLPYKLKDGSGEDLQAMSASSHFFRDATEKKGVVQDYLDIRVTSGEAIPKVLSVMMQLGDEWLEVNVPIDHEKFADLEETFKVDETFEVAGQRITITEVSITPLQVTVDFKSPSSNSKQLIDLIDLRLVDERGRSYTSQTGIGDLDTTLRKHFQVGSFNKAKSLTMVAKGVLMSDRNLKVVIDTEKELMISAPDERLSLSEVVKWDDAIDFNFEMLQDEIPGGGMRAYSLFKFDGTFRDASGQVYPLKYGDSRNNNFTGIRASNDTIIGMYYYHIPNEDYVQPLTFDVYQYQGYVLQDISVPIK
ncbi:DUF4179 domain-containing protein [Paenibacillus sp. 1011MAR3C5]|uniref:DUF4179 domain-containing protein n=1 Tax=Paenibacillus sp. 1011MAR3C5 TaxID=1675787 RepID=UPI000E6B5C37|nr:DUF4179 domain-containing protein [Paenibacillus sp. 1011MAR3C5]RJE82826.1 DUF4179 domain-containing protein [Paenibacillus sp. 1011MAR3C5]